MTTGQIVILLIVGAIISISYFKIAYSIDENKYRKGFLYLFLMMMAIAILSLITVTETIENNDLKKQLKGKCPEYELIEKVYKLKQ